MQTSGPSRFGALRLAQMQRVNEPAWNLELARAVVRAKLSNQRAVLARANWPAAASALGQIDAALAAVDTAVDIDAVRGHEGAGAAAYFGAWRVRFQQSWGFQGRQFYPPPDPINAMLSFGYTLLLHDALTAVQFTGLDPYLGVFHVIEAGRPSLALDLMEEFRPLAVDRIVLELIQTGAPGRDQFERPRQVLRVIAEQHRPPREPQPPRRPQRLGEGRRRAAAPGQGERQARRVVSAADRRRRLRRPQAVDQRRGRARLPAPEGRHCQRLRQVRPARQVQAPVGGPGPDRGGGGVEVWRCGGVELWRWGGGEVGR
ncbi:MAG: CRISPR-associated endonuclease Cas1 [Chloroflexaceae bacterium]|nr:CRISPR-associated endonuclease Cas1 [Chloroflexaceae bacterium]